MRKEDLHRNIDLYFDARLSLAEEDKLFQSLLSFKGNDRKVEEALAVMLVTRMESRHSGMRHGKYRSRLRPLYAAAAALIAVVCISVLWQRTGVDNPGNLEGMVAYVGGVKVSDRSEIMKIIDDQLSEIGESSELFAQTVSSDLEDIMEALNDDGI